MEKLYDKLFPDDSDNDDIIIYNNCWKILSQILIIISNKLTKKNLQEKN